LEFLFPNSTADTLEYYHVIVRKTAHLTEYGFLAFFAARAFFYSSKENLSRIWPILAISIVVFVAVIDETNQSLNPARTGSVIDVLIDFAGGILGISGFYLMLRIWRNIFKQKG
jgi:VanZ family protein